MQRRVESVLADSDAVLFVLNGEQRIGPGDRFIAAAIAQRRRAGGDRAQQGRPARPPAHGDGARRRGRAGRDGRDLPDQRPQRRRRGRRSSSSSSRCCPRGRSSTRPRRRATSPSSVRIAELVREQVLLRTREELPHAVEVEVDEMEEREDGLLVVRARVWAETESQKGILIGAGGRMVKAIGTARAQGDRAAAGPPRAPRPARARAQGLAARRGAARPARHRMTLERIVALPAPDRGGDRRRGAADAPRHRAADAEPAAGLAAQRRAGRGPRRRTSRS